MLRIETFTTAYHDSLECNCLTWNCNTGLRNVSLTMMSHLQEVAAYTVSETL